VTASPWPDAEEPAAGPAVVCPRCETRAARAGARFCRTCGTPLAAGPQGGAPAGEHAQAAEGSGPAAPARRPLLRRPAALAVIAAALALLGAATAGRHLAPPGAGGSEPADPVEEVLALIEGRQGAALAEATGATSPLLSDAALDSGYTPPDDLTAGEVDYGAADPATRRPDRDSATVTVTYRLGGEEHSARVRVQRSTGGWAPSWELADGARGLLGALRVTSPHLDTVLAGGAEVGAADAGSWTGEAAAAPPGTYTIAVPADHPLLAPGTLSEVEVAAGPEATVHEAAEPQVRPDLAEEVAAQVADHLAECATDTTLAPPGCPLQVDRGGAYRTVQDVRWEITAQPEVRLRPAVPEDLHGDPLTVETAAPGTAEATYTYTRSGGGTEHRTVDITVGGSVATDEDGRAVWHP
jgi:hypothetical protein